MKQTSNNSIDSIIRYYVRDIKIGALLGFITALLTFVALIMGGYTPPLMVWPVLVFGFPAFTFFGLLVAIALHGTFPHAFQFSKFAIIGGLSALINLTASRL